MIAARLHGIGDVRVASEADPSEPPPGSSLVRIGSVGLCGSDLHWFTEGGVGETTISRPIVPGHEFAGVALSGPYAGRRVAIDPAIPCEQCETCRSGWQNLCPRVRFAGHGDLDGGLQQLLTWPDHLLFPLPDGVDEDLGALLEPLGVAIHAIDLAHLRLGADVLVVGGGPIGLIAVQILRRTGARRVFVVEPLAHRRDAARFYGADAAWAPDGAGDQIDASTGGRGVDAVLEIAGVDDAIDTAVRAARPGARIVLTGIPAETHSAFPAAAARRKGITFAMSRRMNGTYPRALALVAGGLNLDGIVTARYPLADVGDAFRSAAARTGLKTMVTLG